MVMDFGEVKRIVGAWLDDNVDHVTILSGDPEAGPGEFDLSEADLANAIEKVGRKGCVVACPLGAPTVENMADWLMNELRLVLNLAQSIGKNKTLAEVFDDPEQPLVELVELRLFETPNCWATVTR